MALTEPEAERKTRKLLTAAAVGTIAGVAVSVVGQPALGSLVTVASLLALVTSVHRLGRLGPDAAGRRARLRASRRRSRSV